GKVVATTEPTASEAELASLMVGRAVVLQVDKGPAHPGDPVLEVSGLSVVDPTGQTVVDDVSFEVRAGEIFAVAGVQGNGQTELTEAVMGLLSPAPGSSVRLDGVEMAGREPRDVLSAGVGYVPEDRQRDGLVGDFAISDNLVLDLYHQAPYASGLALHPRAVRAGAERHAAEFDVRTTSVGAPASSLSGGNQQKVVLARALSRRLRLFVASQPTRGVDVGSTEYLHTRIVAERDKGVAVLIVSSELDEVMALADRIAVMYRGRIVGIVGPETSRDEIGLMMAGAGAGAGARGEDGTAGVPVGAGEPGEGTGGRQDGSDFPEIQGER
ncbi:MAG: ATP-binding cassette domain-containing protein, partial [Acidimicrobiales bacterium]